MYVYALALNYLNRDYFKANFRCLRTLNLKKPEALNPRHPEP